MKLYTLFRVEGPKTIPYPAARLRIGHIGEYTIPGSICNSFFFSQTIDMLYFLLIMVVFLLAYGVAQQAILYPNEPASWSVVSGVFFRPYFQVYGELFVEAPDTSETVYLSTVERFRIMFTANDRRQK